MGSAYRIGGTGNWSDTTKWSTTSGGSNDRGVPAASDDVFVDGSSGGGTLTIDGTPVCRSFDSNGFGGTIAGSAAITVGDATAGAGNIAWRWGAGITRTYNGSITFVSTSATQQTITSNGKTFGGGNFTINCTSGGSYALGDAFSTTGNVFITKGTFTTAGYALSCGAWNSANANVRSVNIDNTTVTITTAANTWGMSLTTNLTWSATGSTIILNGGSTSTTFAGGGLTYNNVTINNNGAIVTALNGANNIANLTINGSANKSSAITLSANLTISGTFTIAGNSVTNRVLISSNGVGTARTITCNGTVTASNVDFRDITGAGSASWNLAAITGNSGDAGGNSGITFTTGSTQTWSGTSGGNWSANAWTTRVPLPQDDVVVSSAFSASQTITVDMPRMGKSIDFTGVSGSPTVSGTADLFGSLTLAAGLGTCTSFSVYFFGRGSNTYTSGGKQTNQVRVYGGTVTLQDAMSSSNAVQLAVSPGTFVSSGYSITCLTFNGSNGTCNITNSTVTVTGTSFIKGTGTFTATGSTIHFSHATPTLSPNGGTFNAITIAGGTTLAIDDSMTAASISRNGTTACGVTVTNNKTITLTGGASAMGAGTSGNLITWQSSLAGSAFTISSATTLSTDYISLKDCTGAGAGIPHDAGANSTNVSGNTNWNFGAPVVAKPVLFHAYYMSQGMRA